MFSVQLGLMYSWTVVSSDSQSHNRGTEASPSAVRMFNLVCCIFWAWLLSVKISLGYTVCLPCTMNLASIRNFVVLVR